MADEFTNTFEKLWVEFRARWCDSHDLGGALAFSHERVKISMFHRVVQVEAAPDRVDRLIDDALSFFAKKEYDCAFTLSPLDRPVNMGELLEQRGFTHALHPIAMVCDQAAAPLAPGQAQIEEPTTRAGTRQFDTWADVMCRSFDHPPAMGEVAGNVLDIPEVRLYLARVDGAPAGSTLLYSQFGLGYVDAVGTLPEHRRKGVASALVTRAVADSRAMGNRWTALETDSEGVAEGLYRGLGFRATHYRPRYVMKTS